MSVGFGHYKSIECLLSPLSHVWALSKWHHKVIKWPCLNRSAQSGDEGDQTDARSPTNVHLRVWEFVCLITSSIRQRRSLPIRAIAINFSLQKPICDLSKLNLLLIGIWLMAERWTCLDSNLCASKSMSFPFSSKFRVPTTTTRERSPNAASGRAWLQKLNNFSQQHSTLFQTFDWELCEMQMQCGCHSKSRWRWSWWWGPSKGTSYSGRRVLLHRNSSSFSILVHTSAHRIAFDCKLIAALHTDWGCQRQL